ncbi:uncharacterized protein BP5553_03457 [Venustampulla echinocandica]|uniref:Major facilitator superfamily (MFS) profile domain-containing protein n=1 Tax=Venustampulla echinocandica TaxID=2656787 RepID=A0A370TUA9_9HELO|nr:uncharacterized protein BP5553_03457 [Venustampulla echinocandica]RDL39117.1 hypothetical protein BP5553_03457 [Venustampulla echinocandica]
MSDGNDLDLDLKRTSLVVEVRSATTMATQEELARQGEALEASEKNDGVWRSMKRHRMALVYMLAAYSCAAVYGYDSIANTATLAMPSFQIYFGHFDEHINGYYLDSIWTSLWSSMTGVGQIIGSTVAGPLSQRIGRRYTAMASGSITIIGVALQYVAVSKGLLLAGKMINGAAVGGLLSVGTTYASEIAPPRLRGILLGGLAFFGVAMQCVGLGVVRCFVPNMGPIAFRTALALQWLVGGIPIIAFFFVPESPNFLLLKGRVDAARTAVAHIYGKTNSVDARVAHLMASIQEELQRDHRSSYIDCFKGTDRKRTLTVCLLMFGNGLIGSAFLTQNIYFLGLAGLPAIHAFDINIGGFALALMIIPASWYFGDKIGRRPLYLVGAAGNAVGMGVVGGLGYAPASNKASIWVLAVLLNLLITWQIFTSFMVSWSMSPELSSYKLRQQTQSIGIAVQAFTSWFFAFVTPYLYNVGPDSGNLGAKTGFIFMGSSVVLFGLAYFWVPETQGLTTEELDYLYEARTSPRMFKTSITVMNRVIMPDLGNNDKLDAKIES